MQAVKIRRLILFSLLSFNILLPSTEAAWKKQILQYIQNGSVLAVSQKGEILFSYNADRAFVPASTLKVPTALAAIKILGKNFRYQTEFFLDGDQNLLIKGYGDPFLISEELKFIAHKLKSKGLKKVKQMILDNRYFSSDVQIHGLAGSLNPYDAYNGALLANFNTIYILKSRDGTIRSAEPQTPVTEITRQLAKQARVGKSRINVAVHEREASLYVGYLLKEFLVQKGIPVSGPIRLGPVSASSRKLLLHQSSKSLSQVLKAALKYSQNLIMNQLFLTMGAVKLGAPASLSKARKVFDDFLRKDLGLKNIFVEEGSGISRKNKFTALEMDRVLVKFFPYHELLPIKDGMWVKTGTLQGVSSLVGYFQSVKYGWVRFVIFLNQAGNHRDRIAKILKNNL